MRITTGIYKGRNLKMPKGIRPTQNIVRKAIFDILGDIEGLSFLELFAGSGAVGLEAASRGAKEVVFVENNSQVLKALTQNLSYVLYPTYDILPLDTQVAVKRLAQGGRKFDIIFLDPPYHKETATPNPKGKVGVPLSAAKKTLQTIMAYDILSPTGLIIAQHSKKESLPERLGVLSLLKQSTYGDTTLSFYKMLR
ncbi:MAG: 16S rRNA (guanine(966)-N(2))-methyltransferase RsmD [Candidatus Omnitrophica bacterium CG08_land_8_20_14_0_20_41_16]|uniref:16S rRNA (Guanine(966)-N(2))-methyltransferase RsmD n=1 Tax=Candidatus Sherwoodlollariibacterium unditelluris TaxID=1974757 RepID=A0A2G9YKL8_9BACT|nr:MAG: 16S rRNA (guanine(966)-N(2))-methyltransferase RsmD [Candidatus Omnitrophica bacterium CG23_combo_of_CG06-09_8_20_14_all_41_10]PIS33693.1 MAG: 16S rRNA (guanine(966)-N(2))-methyltransferase RsmD [Candidatus Omnitrophica bacterium CG08_land_8_20_14_0_20_41_16]